MNDKNRIQYNDQCKKCVHDCKQSFRCRVLISAWKTKIRIMIMVTVLMSIGFIMMDQVAVGRIVLGLVWLFHIIYFTFGVNVMSMSPNKKDYGHHNYPLERIEKAILWLKRHGVKKIGIAGASTTGTLALTAASFFSDITLTLAMTPSDFIWQGFMQGKRDGCKE